MGRKIKPHSVEWEKRANELARSFCPEIHRCADCNNPVVKGYCCRYCGSDHPYRESEDNIN